MKLVLIETTDSYAKHLESLNSSVVTIVAIAQSPRPDNFCRCGRKPQLSNMVKGARYGWWVCTECKRPSSAWRAGFITRFEQAFGRNLKGDDADVPAV